MRPRIDAIEDFIKGGIAKMLVEEILMLSGNKVANFGLEYKMPALAQGWDYRRTSSSAGKILSSMPDLVVINERRMPRFVEVKYRAAGPESIDLGQLHKTLHHWASHVILVTNKSRPYFYVTWLTMTSDPSDVVWEPLLGYREWEIRPDVYEVCERLVEKYFPVNLSIEAD